MKNLLILFTLVIATTAVFAQDKPCKELYADLATGTINKVSPNSSMQKIKKKLPCFTGDTEEGSEYNCGGGVFYLKDDFFFYSGKDYIEIRSNFKGTMSPDVMRKDLDAIETMFGKPSRILTEESEKIYLYKKKYGTLRITFGSDLVVRQVGMHAKAPYEVELCY